MIMVRLSDSLLEVLVLCSRPDVEGDGVSLCASQAILAAISVARCRSESKSGTA